MAEDPTGDIVRNLVALRRLSNGIERKARGKVRSIIDDIVAELARIDPTDVKRPTYRRARVDKLMERVNELTGPQYAELRESLEGEIARVGKQQSEWSKRVLGKAIGRETLQSKTLGVGRFRQILKSRPFQGDTLKDWAERARRSTVDNVRQQVQMGMTQDETIGDIIRRIRGRSIGGGRYAGGVMKTSTHHAESIARTAVTFIANEAHLETYQRNASVVRGVEFTATLDKRTTEICARWDGTVWAIDDDSRQVPPLHYNCRSVLRPVIDWEGMDIEPPEPGTRASADGQVPASTTYVQWFRDQPASVQNDIIGPARAKLFRDGKISFKDMIGRDNRVLTVEELEG